MGLKIVRLLLSLDMENLTYKNLVRGNGLGNLSIKVLRKKIIYYIGLRSLRQAYKYLHIYSVCVFLEMLWVKKCRTLRGRGRNIFLSQ